MGVVTARQASMNYALKCDSFKKKTIKSYFVNASTGVVLYEI